MSIEFSVMHTPENISKIEVETKDPFYYTHGVVVFTPRDSRAQIYDLLINIERLRLANVDRALADGTLQETDRGLLIGGLPAESREELQATYDATRYVLEHLREQAEHQEDLYQVVGWARSEEEADEIVAREYARLEWDDTFRTVYTQHVIAIEADA